MGDIVIPAWPHMLLFMLAVLLVASFVITVAGHFPFEHRNSALTGPTGSALLWLSIVLAAIVGAATIVYAWFVLPWYFAIIGGGLMILIAPYVLHPLPNHMINGRVSLIVLCAMALLVAGGMWLSVA